jgi:predicted DNA-binding protein
MTEKKLIHIRLDPEMAKRVKRLANEQDISEAEVVRRSIDALPDSIGLRLDDDLLARVKAAAQRQGCDVPEWIRNAIDAQLEPRQGVVFLEHYHRADSVATRLGCTPTRVLQMALDLGLDTLTGLGKRSEQAGQIIAAELAAEKFPGISLHQDALIPDLRKFALAQSIDLPSLSMETPEPNPAEPKPKEPEEPKK